MRDPELYDLAVNTAEQLLGGGWAAVVPPDNYPGIYLHGPGQARLYLRRAERDRTRVAVSGRYPDTDVQPKSLAITVAWDRGPEWLASSIERRLLPEYLSTLAEVLERNRQRDRAAERRRYNAGELAALLAGATVRDDGKTSTIVHWYRPVHTAADAPSEASVELSYDGQHACHLQLRSVPVDLAEQILRLIQQRV